MSVFVFLAYFIGAIFNVNRIATQANKDGIMPAFSTKPTYYVEMQDCEEGEWLMNQEGVIYRTDVAIKKKTKSPPVVHIDANSNTIERKGEDDANNFPSSKPNVGSASTRKLPDLPLEEAPFQPAPPPPMKSHR